MPISVHLSHVIIYYSVLAVVEVSGDLGDLGCAIGHGHRIDRVWIDVL